MTISMDLSLKADQVSTPVSVSAPVTTIAADGWQATYDGTPPAEMDPSGDPETVTVTRQGFDASGGAVSVNDTVTLMKRVRQPYPNQGSLTADSIALSDFVYAGDTIAGVANNSTRTYPKPICCWLHGDHQIAAGPTFTARVAVAHMHARSGRPVAAVTFSVTDGVSTVTETVSAMSTITYTASGLTVPHFAAALDISGFAVGAELTVDVTVYPWVGEAFDSATDASASPSINFCSLPVWKATASRAYAYVNASTGNDGAGVASGTEATAAASPFATLAAAVAAVRSWNNANLGYDDAGGAIVVLEDGTHVFSSIRSAAGATTTGPLTVQGESRAGAVLQDSGSNLTFSIPGGITFRNMTFRMTGNYTFIDNGGTGLAPVLCEDVSFDVNGNPDFYEAWFYRIGRFYLIDCDANGALLARKYGGVKKEPNLVGCSGLGWAYNMLGCRSAGFNTGSLNDSGREAAAGSFIGWNCLTATNSGGTQVLHDDWAIGAEGFAMVGNVVEDVDGTTSPALQVMGDSSAVTATNVVIQCNTVVGQRSNLLYNDTTNISRDGSVRFNVFSKFNTKTDVFAADGTAIGNWAAAYHVGYHSNAYLTAASDGQSTFGAGHWIGEVGELGASLLPTPDWTDDASADGSGLGGGDYTPGASSTLPTIPAGLAPYGHDLNGTALAGDGTDLSGAVQA